MQHFPADDGEPIHLRVSGNGPPLILLHGWTDSHRSWKPFLPDFEAQHTVYRWDARGHGGHPLKTNTEPTAQRMARDLANLIEQHALSGATVIGHSMGALTLWQYFRDFGAKGIERAVIIDQSPKLVTGHDWHCGIYGDFSAVRNQAFIDALEHDFAETVLRLVADGMNRPAAERYAANDEGIALMRSRLRKLSARPLIDCWRSLTAADYRDVLATIPIPVLLVYGGASNFYHVRTAHFVRDSIPNAVLHVYDNEDHAPHLWQRERFVKDVLEFVQ